MKKPLIALLALAGAVGAAPPAAHAQDALVPLPSVPDYTNGEGWATVAGLGFEHEPAYDGSDESGVELQPVGALQWRTGNHLFYMEGLELGWRGVILDDFLVQAGVNREEGRGPSDSEEGYLRGTMKRDAQMAGFLEVRYAMARDWRAWVGGRVQSGESELGLLGVLAAGYRFEKRTDGLGTEIFAYTTLADSDSLNRDFGVTAEEAKTSRLAATSLDSGYRSVGVNLIHRREFQEKAQIVLEAGYEKYGSDISDSPIARQDYEVEIGVSVVYKVGGK